VGNYFDIAIVGAGIVGLTTGHEILCRFPQLRVLLLEKEKTIAAHQTSHNSGVIHSGIYYKPESMKAETCREGPTAIVEFCQRHSLPYPKCGKVILATTESELPRLQELYNRGRANGVSGLELIGPERLRELEPHATGIRATPRAEHGNH